jgi:hypothetical protein
LINSSNVQKDHLNRIYTHFILLEKTEPTTIPLCRIQFPINNAADTIAMILSLTVKPPATLEVTQLLHQFGVILLAVAAKWVIRILPTYRPAMATLSLVTRAEPTVFALGFSRSSLTVKELKVRRSLLGTL